MFGINPWVILAVVVAFVASNGISYTSGHGNGVTAERVAWQAEEIKKQAAIVTAKEKAAADIAALQKQFDDFKTEVEKNYAEKDKKITGMGIANSRLIAATGGLYDKNGRAVGGAAGSKPAGAADGTEVAATGGGCRLSEATSQSLLDDAILADRTNNYASLAYAWIDKLYTTFTCKPVTAPVN